MSQTQNYQKKKTRHNDGKNTGKISDYILMI